MVILYLPTLHDKFHTLKTTIGQFEEDAKEVKPSD